jgi:hypothetical protein
MKPKNNLLLISLAVQNNLCTGRGDDTGINPRWKRKKTSVDNERPSSSRDGLNVHKTLLYLGTVLLPALDFGFLKNSHWGIKVVVID